ncbi:MAG: Ig domain-containing protein [Microcoleaceae cyanobacterium]
MKKILMFMFMGCLVVVLGFPRPAAADRIDRVLADLNSNHQAIGQAIPKLHKLEIPPPGSRGCGNIGLTDKTIFEGSGSYGCLSLIDIYANEPAGGGLRGLLTHSEKQVVNIPSTVGNQLGRYFTGQYPEFAIIGANVKVPFWFQFNNNALNYYGYKNTYPSGEQFQVDKDAVFWEQIPSNDNTRIPTVHELLIAENYPASDLQIGYVDNLPDPGSIMSPLNSRTAIYTKSGFPPLYFRFDHFYLVLFGSYAPIDRNTIETIVRTITTGNPPSIFSVNPSFSFPELTRNSTTNLPIDVSTAFTSSVNTSTYTLLDIDLPDGLKFDPTTKSIIADPSALPPAGPKRSGSYPVPITVNDGNGHKLTHTFNLTVNP